MDLSRFAVPAEKLRWQCDAGQFQFECTKDLPVLDEFVGQDRAIRAIEFGLNMHNAGYNLFVAGLSGTGKTSLVKEYIHRLIAKLAGEGVAVIMISSEMPEVLGMSDRIMVVHEGRITGFLDRKDADQVKIMELASH